MAHRRIHRPINIPGQHYQLTATKRPTVRYTRDDVLPVQEDIQGEVQDEVQEPVEESPPVGEDCPQPEKTKKQFARYSLLVTPKITAIVPADDVGQLEGAKLYPATQSDRFDFFDVAPNVRMVERATFVTDIFLCKLIVFPSDSSVEVKMPDESIRPKHTHFVAAMKLDSKWTKMPSQTGFNTTRTFVFPCAAMEGIFVLLEPMTTDVNLTSFGYTYKARDDSGITCEFPKDSVEHSAKVKIMVVPMNNAKAKDEEIPQISPILHVAHSPDLSLRRPVKLQLPLNDTDDDDDPSLYTTTLLKWSGINVEVVKRDMMPNDGAVGTEVDSFSGYSVANISTSYLMSSTTASRSMKLLLLEGRLKLCKILSFVDRRDTNSLWFECVLKDKIDEVVKKNEMEGLFHLPKSKSPDLHLFDGHKVRIFPEGCIQLAKGYPRNKNVLVFLSSAEENHITFPVEKRLSSAAYAVLNFESASRHWQKTLHTFHYIYERDLMKQGTVLPVVDHYTTQLAKEGTKEGDKKRHDTSDARASSRRVQSGQTATTTIAAEKPLHDDVFSDRSMQALARALPPRLTSQFGIELGLSMTDITRMKGEDMPQEEIMLAIIKKSVTNVRGGRQDKLNKLVSALEEFDLNSFADVLKRKFEQNECLRRKDFD